MVHAVAVAADPEPVERTCTGLLDAIPETRLPALERILRASLEGPVPNAPRRFASTGTLSAEHDLAERSEDILREYATGGGTAAWSWSTPARSWHCSTTAKTTTSAAGTSSLTTGAAAGPDDGLHRSLHARRALTRHPGAIRGCTTRSTLSAWSSPLSTTYVATNGRTPVGYCGRSNDPLSSIRRVLRRRRDQLNVKAARLYAWRHRERRHQDH